MVIFHCKLLVHQRVASCVKLFFFLPEKHLIQNHRAELDPRSSKGSHMVFPRLSHMCLVFSQVPPARSFPEENVDLTKQNGKMMGFPAILWICKKGQLGVFFSMHILDCETIMISMFCICSMNFMRFPYTCCTLW